MEQQTQKNRDSISKKLAQLDALMTIAASEQFNEFSEITRTDALWLCKDLTSEVKHQFNSIGDDIPIISQK